MLILYDRYDEVVPYNGKPSTDGWIYEYLQTVISNWQRVLRCDKTRKTDVKLQTKWSEGELNVECKARQGCEDGVVWCMYNGNHGSWPEFTEDMFWTWFNSDIYYKTTLINN